MAFWRTSSGKSVTRRCASDWLLSGYPYPDSEHLLATSERQAGGQEDHHFRVLLPRVSAMTVAATRITGDALFYDALSRRTRHHG